MEFRYEDFKNFEKYVPRQAILRFLVRYELFKKQLNIKGSIIECGVHHGGGLMAWAKLSAALEPYALDRRVIGFDTFEGFVNINNKDKQNNEINNSLYRGGFSVDYNVYAQLINLVDEFDKSRFLNEFQKVFLVKGDATKTIPKYCEENPHLLVSLLFLDFDLYEPTKIALRYFLPRMSKGAILAFDEINNPWWPGETIAMLEELSINEYKIERFNFDPNISYIVL